MRGYLFTAASRKQIVLERVIKPSAPLLSLGHVACGREFCYSLLILILILILFPCRPHPSAMNIKHLGLRRRLESATAQKESVRKDYDRNSADLFRDEASSAVTQKED